MLKLYCVKFSISTYIVSDITYNIPVYSYKKIETKIINHVDII